MPPSATMTNSADHLLIESIKGGRHENGPNDGRIPLIISSGMVLKSGIKRTDLQRNDLRVPGRETV